MLPTKLTFQISNTILVKLFPQQEQLEKEKQQNEGRSTSMSDKMYEKKRKWVFFPKFLVPKGPNFLFNDNGGIEKWELAGIISRLN